jgi:hypothetical protein
MLARSGVGCFVLIDHARYELSDMNRDGGCYVDTLGKLKAEVIRDQLLGINPGASVEVVTAKLALPDLGPHIASCDVFFAQSEDLAMSVHALMAAQRLKKLAVTVMPSGLTSYVEVFPPGAGKVTDPAAMFGAPAGLSHRELSIFLRSPLNRCGRRWHVTEGKWRIDWFKGWRDGKEVEAQLCPGMWLGASLAAVEAIKYITGRWQRVSAPKMCHSAAGDNRVKVERYRRRSFYFEKFIFWTFGIRFLGIGKRYHRYTARRLMRELDYLEKQEKEGKKQKLPWIWHWI